MAKPQVYRALGLKDQEYKRIEELLGREPSSCELAMFSVEWSEHCGYPRSSKYLKLLPKSGRYKTLVGEDSGGVIVDDTAVIFKMESHNHPSQVEPKQGAATGIGGIVRDIFTVGARPIACMDSLHFGELKNPHAQYLLGGVVDGIAMYGNCLGVPTVGGEIYFDDSYAGNCLVNVMSLGLAKAGKLAKARAFGAGNAVIYVGSKTGRDGIGGCSILASHEFGEEDKKRPTVQIGDPFTEKCLIEATLEALQTGHVIGIKDMGAAGLTCSISETASSGNSGADIELQLIPRREEGMEPWEIMMSESQERMLLCVKKGKEKEVQDIFSKWDLEAVIIGRVRDDGILCIKDNGRVVAEVKAKDLTTPPVYDMPSQEPGYIKQVQSFDFTKLSEPDDYNGVLLQLLASPNIASKEWVYEQYDHMVQVNTVSLPGASCAVLRVKGKKWGIGITTDCNGIYCYLDPYRGAQIAVAEAARNLVCAGCQPAGVTDCLNFGNPEKPDRFWQFKNCVEGLADACKFFNIAVVSGNVSFYNESPRGTVNPTPTIGMVGIIKDVERHVTVNFKNKGDRIILLGQCKDELGGSEYLKVVHGLKVGTPPEVELDLERRVQDAVLGAIENGLVNSAQDCSEGGLAVALSECCISDRRQRLGARFELSGSDIRKDALLFGETQSRIVLSCSPQNLDEVKEAAAEHKAPFREIGEVGGDELVIRRNGEVLIASKIEDLEKAWRGGLNINR